MKRHVKGFVALLLAAAFFLCNVAAGQFIKHVLTVTTTTILEEYVEQGSSNVRTIFIAEENKMQTISAMLASHSDLDSETVYSCIKDVPLTGIITSLSVLLPDDEIVHTGNAIIEDYSSININGNDIEKIKLSNRFVGLDGDEYVALVTNIMSGDIYRGTLIGGIRLNNLPKIFDISAYGNQSQLYLVNGYTGDFLMDTWHSSLGNMYDSSLNGRKTKDEVSFEQSKIDVKNGRSGFLVFESSKTGDDFYSYYAPVGYKTLTFQITVPYKVAFADYISVRNVIYFIYIIQIVMLTVYIVYLRQKNKNETEQMRQLVNVDGLTQLKNRTLFQERVDFLKKNPDTMFACIYIDANGLRELNDSLGHYEGDTMLSTIASEIKLTFGFENSYCIGGDEFVVILTDYDEDKIRMYINALKATLLKDQCFIAVGVAYKEHSSDSIQGVMQQAEQKMYIDKDAYYSSGMNKTISRERNDKLDAIMLEKKDNDMFLSEIQNLYLGVYIVNAKHDECRPIFISGHLESFLSKNNNCFSVSFKKYAMDFVSEKDFKEFCKLLNFTYVDIFLANNKRYEFIYSRKDSSKVRIQITALPNTEKEYLWIFEEI